MKASMDFFFILATILPEPGPEQLNMHFIKKKVEY